MKKILRKFSRINERKKRKWRESNNNIIRIREIPNNSKGKP